MLAESGNLLLMEGRARDQKNWVLDAKMMLDIGEKAFSMPRKLMTWNGIRAERFAQRRVRDVPSAVPAGISSTSAGAPGEAVRAVTGAVKILRGAGALVVNLFAAMLIPNFFNSDFSHIFRQRTLTGLLFRDYAISAVAAVALGYFVDHKVALIGGEMGMDSGRALVRLAGGVHLAGAGPPLFCACWPAWFHVSDSS